MFNGFRIRELLKEQNRTEREFVKFFWPGKKGDIPYLEKKTSVNSTTLEKLTSFFKCSMDEFFTKPQSQHEDGQQVVGNSNIVSSFNVTNDMAKEIQYLNNALLDKERLIEEKDERIKILQSYLDDLRNKKSDKNRTE